MSTTINRFSEGMEQIPPVASVLRVGRFGDGMTAAPTAEHVRRGMFADGLAAHPDAPANCRVGCFGDVASPTRRLRRAGAWRRQLAAARI
jgi:hypothetical protein